MKKLCLLFIIIGLVGCKSDDLQETSVYGIWRLVQTYGFSTEGSGWYNYPGESYIQLNHDGSVTTNGYGYCGAGTFTYTDDILELTLTCEDTSGDMSEYIVTYAYEFNGKYLELYPAQSDCIEGCGNRYLRMD